MEPLEKFSSEAGFNVPKLAAEAIDLATHSWEHETLVEALLELHNAELSILDSDPFPGGHFPLIENSNIAALSYAKPHIRTNETILMDGEGRSNTSK
jgi:hypothetical protein